MARSLGVDAGDNTSTGGTDVGPLRTSGVPILSLDLKATYYFDIQHTTNDTLNQIDPAKLSQSTAVDALGASLAASEAPPPGAAPAPPPAK